MRNNAHKHKVQLCEKDPASIHPHMNEDYRIQYITSTNKLIVMKPEAEIDYDLHARSPKKFYAKVFDQEIEKVKVKETHEGFKNPDGSPRRRQRGEMSPVRITHEVGTRTNMIECDNEQERKANARQDKINKKT